MSGASPHTKFLIVYKDRLLFTFSFTPIEALPLYLLREELGVLCSDFFEASRTSWRPAPASVVC